MVLKRLELHGFKSFPDKTLLDFGEGVTAVVGPNGSGKSNVGDAVRWVLGEQNCRTLRCEKKMDELIFHGTAKRNAVGFCEASIVLDNTARGIAYDGDEVVITRRLYRSGESEYYINKASVRLKDVSDLFLDTGLGRDGYSIIGQGRISEVISERSGDRRRIFEEAAGIARYRVRKEESQRKLKHADDNLVRIQDKIDELQWQLDPLVEQAEVAKRYLLARDELRQLEINVWLENLDNLRRDGDKARAECRIADEQFMARKAGIEALYAESTGIDETLEVSNIAAEECRQQYNQAQEQAAETETLRAVKQTEREHQQQTAQRLHEELQTHLTRDEDLVQQIEGEQTAIETLEQSRALLSEQETLLRRELNALQENTSGIALALDDARLTEQTARAAAAECSTQLAAEQAAVAQWHAQIDSISQAQTENEAVLTQARTDLDQYNQKLRDIDETLTAHKNILQGYELRRETRGKKLEQQRAELELLRLNERELLARRTTLTAMEREYEGFSNSVKTVMNNAKNQALQGIHGAIGDIITVEDKYAAAIETTLGGALQNIVVDNEDDAKAAISLLKARNSGRATFLPITAVRGRELNEPSLQSASGFVGIASHLVQYDSQYSGIIAQLLGRTVVAEHIDAAIALSRAYKHQFRIVTLDGQIIHAGGSMTGGSLARTTNILSRRNELDRIIAKHDVLKNDIAVKNEAFLELDREVTAVNYDYETSLEQSRVAENERRIVLSEGEHANRRVTELEAAAVTHMRQLEELRKSITASLQLQDQHTRTAANHLQRAEEAKALQDNHLAGQNTLSQEGETLTNTLSTLRDEQFKADAQLLAHRKSIADIESLRQSLSGDHETRTANQLACEESVVRLDSEIKQLVTQKQAQDNEAEKLNVTLHEIYERRNALEGKRGTVERQIREHNDDIIKLEQEKSRLELKRESAESEEKAIIDKLWDNYGLTRSAATAARTDIDSLPKANRRIGALRQDINDMGAVNVGAIEEYDRVKERHNYLSEQRDDAAAAQQELLAMIEEITAQMANIFTRQFAQINELFGATFSEIFGGGAAYLELEDPEDILNCGVEIKAQPPGKKMRSITLLSGGEKSLVAIALYFSLFKVRPAPFCLLDEIDHELDDVNVTRFAAYLDKMARNTQCIVITHRRGTMEAANKLYGVTTVEEGISKIITLTLDDAEGV
ncbi:MAG: chromosome segregation protein SMC [Oscillospiraceae bacterium]|nr:chromosome segregation protein SMC [Oscillospiraceae bacterium]